MYGIGPIVSKHAWQVRQIRSTGAFPRAHSPRFGAVQNIIKDSVLVREKKRSKEPYIVGDYLDFVESIQDINCVQGVMF